MTDHIADAGKKVQTIETSNRLLKHLRKSAELAEIEAKRARLLELYNTEFDYLNSQKELLEYAAFIESIAIPEPVGAKL